MSTGLTRREFIAFFSATAALAGCPGGEIADGGPDVDPVLPPGDEYNLDIWYADLAMAQEVLRASEDHLSARAQRLVAAKDAAGLHALVQQELRLIPTSSSEIVDADLVVMHQGPASALRSGAGTAREQGELLRQLYEDAGFVATLHTRRVTVSAATLQAMLTAGLDRDIVPKLTPEQEARMRRAPGVQNPQLVVVQPTADAAKTLADSLAQLAFVGVEPRFLGGDQSLELPVVKVIVDGTATWADPLLQNVGFGELVSANGENAVYALDAPAEVPEVEVELLWTQANDSNEETVLVGKTWPANELVGKSMSASMVAVASMQELAYTPQSSLALWQPVLAIDGEAVATGPLRSIGGEIVEIDVDEGTMTWAGKPLGLTNAPALSTRVASITMSAHAGSFPDVRLRVGAYDADGEPVEGLGAGQFIVEEEGERVGVSLTANLRAGRRVLIVSDNSSSVDEAFRGDAFVELVGKIYDATALVEPDVRWAVAPILFGARMQGPFTGDRAALLAQATGSSEDGSELWAALRDAGRYDADVVILISDGEATDVRTDVNPASLSSCPQVIAVYASQQAEPGRGAATMAEIVALLGGVVLNPSDVVEVADALAEALSDKADAWYQLDYFAPIQGPPLRNVTVRLAAAPVVRATYEVPAVSVVAERAPVSLRLRVRVGDRSVTRTIVGLPPREYAFDDEVVLAKAMAEVRDSLGLGASLTFEATGATFTQGLDRFVGERLACKPAAEWLRRQRPLDTFAEEVGGMPSPRPSASVALLNHTVDSRIAGVPTAPLGIQVVAEYQRMVRQSPEKSFVARTVDILPLTEWCGVGANGDASRRATLEACLRQALSEGALPGTSTMSALAGQALVLIPANATVQSVIAGLSDEQKEAWALTLSATEGRAHLVPASGAHLGAWAVDPKSGTTVGLLPGGAGGSKTLTPIESIKELKKVIETALGVMAILGAVAGVPAQWGGVIAVSIFNIRMWSLAAIMLESLTVYSSEMSEKDICEVDRQVNEMVCSIIKGIMLGPFSALDVTLGTFELFAGLSGGSSICEALTKAEKQGAC